MKIGKIELTQEKLIIAVPALIILIVLAIYLILYAPLISKLKIKYIECESAENEVLECRNIIELAGEAGLVIIAEKDVSHAIDELTKHGKLKGINFLSIIPKEVKKEKGSQYKVLPIEMKIESTYEELGILLGSLDELDKGLLKVESFDIIPDRENPSKFITDLVVKLYVSGK